MFVNKLTKLFTTYLVERKRSQVKDVATTYLDAVNDSVPVLLDAYREIAHNVIDKTFDRPEVLLDFVRASEAMLEHYGPALAPFDGADRRITQVVSAKLKTLNDQLETLIDASK